MNRPLTAEELCAQGASLHGWMQEDMQAAVDYYLTDLLPDPPRTNTYSDLKEWFQQLRRGPVTLSGMLEAYRRGRLDEAAASAARIKELEARVAELEAGLPRRKDHRADAAAGAMREAM